MERHFQTLGIPPDAGILEVKRAYLRMKNLYAEGSLATYTLLDDEERRGKLEAIEEAYQALSHGLAQRSVSPPLREEQEGPGHLHLDPADSPGLFLKRLRESQGLPRSEIASRTKISTTTIDCIEQERFDHLPAPVYLRGFIHEYARALGYPDPAGLASRFLERFRQQSSDT
jgi:flagellar biosynthesis protein FlhG